MAIFPRTARLPTFSPRRRPAESEREATKFRRAHTRRGHRRRGRDRWQAPVSSRSRNPGHRGPARRGAPRRLKTVDRAVASGARGFRGRPLARSRPSRTGGGTPQIAQLILENSCELAWLEVLDNGKTMAEGAGGREMAPRRCSTTQRRVARPSCGRRALDRPSAFRRDDGSPSASSGQGGADKINPWKLSAPDGLLEARPALPPAGNAIVLSRRSRRRLSALPPPRASVLKAGNPAWQSWDVDYGPTEATGCCALGSPDLTGSLQRDRPRVGRR